MYCVLQWLEEGNLDAWESSVRARPNYKTVEKKMMLSTETLLGLRITGMVLFPLI